jgi:acetylornithine deacetylase/succinyl-diaminopimelate desuccinylase-like protein
MHLAALRALRADDFPLGLKLLAEGAEEQGTGGLEEFVAANGDLLAADVVLVCDTGNVAVGVPTLTTSLRGVAEVILTVTTMRTPMHSGMFGGPAPDALTALIRALATLHDDRGDVTITGLDADQTWGGAGYDADAFRTDANLLNGVDLAGSGSVSDMLWARPAVSVLGMDVPPVVGSASLVQATARARVSLRVPPGMDARLAQDKLASHLRAAVPWGATVKVETPMVGQAFVTDTGGPAYQAMSDALAAAYGRPTTTQGQGGSIPLCNVFSSALPGVEVILMGVEEPLCRIHAPDESVDPSEIEHIALAEALFLQQYAGRRKD